MVEFGMSCVMIRGELRIHDSFFVVSRRCNRFDGANILFLKAGTLPPRGPSSLALPSTFIESVAVSRLDQCMPGYPLSKYARLNSTNTFTL